MPPKTPAPHFQTSARWWGRCESPRLRQKRAFDRQALSYNDWLIFRFVPLAMQFLRYVMVGGIAFTVDFGVLWLGVECVKCGVYLATAAGFCAGLVVNYVLSLIFVFTQSVEKTKGRDVKSFIIFGIIGLIGLGLSELGMWFGVAVLKVNYPLVKIFVSGGVLVWNFAARKIIIFR